MKLNKILVAGVVAIASLSSCSDDFLETTPTATVLPSDVFATTDNVKAAVNGIAYVMHSQYYSFSQGCCGENRIISIYNEYPSQEFRYNGYAAGWAPIMNGQYYTRTSTSYCRYPWAYYYLIIGNANSIILHAEEAKGDDAEKLFYKAQALTYRAYAYTKLLELFTPRWQDTNNGAVDGVVLRLDESQGGLPLSTVAECYAQIYADLDEAIADFKASKLNRDETDVWLTNINVAYGVYARAALHKQDYAKALETAKLAREGYALMSNSEYKAGFATPTSEWIFGSHGSADENQWYWSFGTQFACNGYYAQNTRYGAGAIEKELTDRMPTNDVRMSRFLTADKLEGYDVTDTLVMNQIHGYFLNSAAKAAEAYCNAATPSGYTKPYQYGYYYLGAQLKFWVFDLPGVSYLPLMRSSEMVLIEAEANYFLGKEADAQAALVELNATSGRNSEYTCTKTGDDLFQEIVDYRELELWGEGFNWYDMKRWKKDIVRKSIAEGGNCYVSTAVTIAADGSDWTWDIPDTETLYNSEIE